MARRDEAHAHIADADRLAIGCNLRRPRVILTIAQGHDVEGLGRGEHMGMAGPGVIGMAVGDERARYRTQRIDVKIPRRAIKPLRRQGEQFLGAWRHGAFIAQAPRRDRGI